MITLQGIKKKALIFNSQDVQLGLGFSFLSRQRNLSTTFLALTLARVPRRNFLFSYKRGPIWPHLHTPPPLCFVVVQCFIASLCFAIPLLTQVLFCPLLVHCYSMPHCSLVQIGTSFCSFFSNVLEFHNLTLCLGGSLEASISKLAISFLYSSFAFLNFFLGFPSLIYFQISILLSY